MMKQVAANLQIGAGGCDFKGNPQGPVEGDFSKDMATSVYVGAGLGVLAVAFLVYTLKKS